MLYQLYGYIYKLIWTLLLYWNKCFYFLLYHFHCGMQINYNKYMSRYMRKVHLTLSASKIIHIFRLLCNGIHGKYSEKHMCSSENRISLLYSKMRHKICRSFGIFSFSLTHSHALSLSLSPSFSHSRVILHNMHNIFKTQNAIR